MTGVSVLNPASASQLPFSRRQGLNEYQMDMQIQAF